MSETKRTTPNRRPHLFRRWSAIATEKAEARHKGGFATVAEHFRPLVPIARTHGSDV